MSRMVTIAGRFVERSAWVIAAPWAATIGIILLLHWAFDVVRVVGAPSDEAVQRLDGRAGADHAVLDQTSPVYSMSLLTHTGRGSYGPAATRPEWVPPLDCRHRVHGGDAIAFERKLGDALSQSSGGCGSAAHGRAAVRRDGYLRMVMTALLNATHDSKDPMTFEMTIQELLKRQGWEKAADRAGLDIPRLLALKAMVDAGHGVFAVPALGSHSPDAWDAVTECVASQAARWRRAPADRAAYRWTAREFADRGIALHPLEVAAQRHAAASQPVDEPEAGLHWESGRALFGIDTEAPWFRAVSVERGFPVTTGISGSAARLHSVFIWIRPEGISEHEFTCALIGWILPSDHHSLYEIIRGIQVASPSLFHERATGS